MMLLRCCEIAVVPAAWRIQSMSVTLQRMYFALTCFFIFFKAVSDVESQSRVSWEIILPFATVALGSLCALSRATSKPCVYEAIEILFWCSVGCMASASVLAVEDSCMKQNRIMINVAAPLLLPALLGIRFWVYLIMVPCVIVMNVFVLQYMLHFQAETVHYKLYAYSPIIAICCLGASLWQNTLLWGTYSMHSALVLEKEAMERLTFLTCDATCWLADERGTVSTCDDRVTEVFQVDMNRKALTDMVASEQDALQLTHCLANAHKNEQGYMPVTKLPITIVRCGVQVRLDLLIVHQKFALQKVVAKGQLDDRLFFVGIRFSQTDNMSVEPPLLNGDDALDAISDQSIGGLDVFEQDDGEDDGRDNARSESVLSLPRTTRTGRIFNLAEGPTDMGECLADVKALIEKEKWFIPPAHLKLRANGILGEGGFGSVVVGKFHGASVAVKLPKINASSTGIRLLCNELRILRHARHPNLVQCFGAVIDVTCCRFGLVLELVPGISLLAFRFHMSDNVGQEQRFQVIAGVTDALSYLHSRFPVIVHGDLKPDNVLIELRQVRVVPKLLDFGLSRLLTSSVKPLDGTLRWTAPEVLQRGGTQAKPSADVFSLGYVIYFTTTGNLPYANLSRCEIKACYRAGTCAELTWSSQSAFSVMSKHVAETCLRPLEQRPGIHEISSMLMAWSNRDGADDLRNTWRDFSDMDDLRQPTSGEHGRAVGIAGHRPSRNADEPRGVQNSLAVHHCSRRLTSENAKVQSFIDLMQHWSFDVPSRGCCTFHRGVVEMQALCSRMERASCITFPSDLHSNQCIKCGWLIGNRVHESCDQCPICKAPLLLRL
eukprot:TRINITY_DN6085_c0_g1_i1.p1 TRINITY_DN6085_c0_g1~~TRINITY_DN6085_c0_g1_i1.p1  ORF type:complete len:832 (+),score=54.79 TRINITY_DN6085_c0_g1_i1:101-2596(+)